ncbi:MAG: PEGA domain-containing protein [Myxococcales bacterium]|nr:PEGA domain-containing protein [Myxococcales bacterium]
MSIKSWIGVGALLALLDQQSFAQSRAEPMDVAVNGPAGALLLMDGQAMGKLPLPVNLSVPAGPHRFRMQLGNQIAESDTLTFPGSGQAELHLTLSGRSLVTVLRIADGLLLLPLPDSLAPSLRAAMTESVATATKAQHSVLIAGEKASVLGQRRADILGCIDQGECSQPLFADGQVSYVLSLRIANGVPDSSASCLLRAELLDTRTREVSARAESTATPCRAATLSVLAGELTGRLLQETVMRPRGTVAVTSEPAGANVRVDGRWLGVTPFQQESFAGPRALELQKARHLPYQQTVQVEPNQTATLHTTLVRDPASQLSRPLWRLVTGSILLGGGLLVAGFGVSALLTHGACQDGSMNIDTCTPYYNTTPVGAGLVGSGAALTIAGTLLLAIPSR